jgi:hypothetical protein
MPSDKVPGTALRDRALLCWIIIAQFATTAETRKARANSASTASANDHNLFALLLRYSRSTTFLALGSSQVTASAESPSDGLGKFVGPSFEAPCVVNWLFFRHCSLLLSFSGIAQSNYAVLSGSILDPQAHAVAGAMVELTSATTGAVRRVSTNAQGLYEVPRPFARQLPASCCGAGLRYIGAAGATRGCAAPRD